jgi:hypothetical protein
MKTQNSTAGERERARITGPGSSRSVVYRGRSDDANAFLPDPFATTDPQLELDDDAAGAFAEELGEEFVVGVTGNIDISEQEQDRLSEDETGGPFVNVSASREMADDIDDSNPVDATREPFPTAMRGT